MDFDTRRPTFKLKNTNMKFKIISLIVALFTFVNLNAQKIEDPIEYNDVIIDQQFLIYDKLEALENAMTETTLDEKECDAAFKDAIKSTKNAIKIVEKLGPLDSNDDFQQTGIELFKTILSALKKEYKDLYKLYKIPLDDFTDEDDEKMWDLWDIVDNKIIEKEDAFIKAQEEFATKNGFILK